jgi:serine protease Do/serine protease DegQ
VNVEPNSAAQKAGLRSRDVVLGFNGRPVRSGGDLRNRIGLTPIGEEVELRVLREGNPVMVRARIAEPFAGAKTAVAGDVVPQLAGSRVANIEPGMPLYGQIEGAVVTAVERDSAAHRNGLRAGDIVYGVNRRRVRNAQELLATLKGTETPWRMSILRGDSRIGLVVR